MLLVRQITLSSNKELFQAAEAKNNECRQLKQDLELKNAQIASYEEARKKDEGDKFSLPSAFSLFFTRSSTTCFSRTFLVIFFVELLSTAREILANSGDMQALMNETILKLKADHAKELEKRDLAHAQALSKLTEQLQNLGDS